MGGFSFLSFLRTRKPQTASLVKNRKLLLEALEDRFAPSATTISGFVYQDTNNNGIFDQGEMPIANSSIQLKDANSVVIGTTTTNAQGYYEFTTDNSINTQPATLTKTVTFQDTKTNYNQNGALDKFDPTLGTLQSVEIIHKGTITSEIKVENTSPVPDPVIQATVSGSLTLTAGAVTSTVNPSQNVGSFSAGAFDNVVDFTGPSGNDFGAKSASDSQSLTLTGNDMNAFIGTGTLNVNETAKATSSASGNGNLATYNNSSASAQVTVIYHYLPTNALKPGNYTIYQTVQPPGFLDGQESSGGVLLNHPTGSDFIPVVLGQTSLTSNNFGEIAPSSISGFVYHDLNNNGIKDAGEVGISGVAVTLNSAAGPMLGSTDANGFYQFTNLNPGTYSLTEEQPAGWLDGKDTIGSLGGTAGNDLFTNIVLPQGGQGVNNNFGELKAASLSGFVYADANNNGIMDAGEQGIAGTTVKLAGQTSDGPVSVTAITDATGAYQFVNLKPGTYALTETQPAGYLDGKDTVGSQGGNTSNDNFSSIVLQSGANGINNNFGELGASSISGFVYADASNDGVKDAGELSIPGVLITLSGTDDLGNVNKTAISDPTGAYHFNNLRPGTYTVTETQPVSYLDGKDTVGSLGGSASNDQFSTIVVAQSNQGTDYNFGELNTAKLSGHVFVDANDNGIRDVGEAAIAGVTVTLSGSNDLGPVQLTAITDASGAYSFNNLRPGTYNIDETQPSAYDDGKDALGSLGGLLANDSFDSITVAAGNNGSNYDFGEKSREIADLAIVKTVNSQSVPIGTTLHYTLTISNLGTSTAQGVTVTDALPPDAIYVSASGAGWNITQSGLTITATTPSMASGASSVIYVTVKAPGAPTTLVNTGTVTSVTPDPNPGNNTSTVTTLVYTVLGSPFPKTLTPLVTSFGAIPVISKTQLLGSTFGTTGSTQFMSATAKGQAAFIDGTYRTLLGRGPTTAELQSGMGQLSAGVPRPVIVSALWNTDVHRGLQVDQYYQIFLNRMPTGAERMAGIQTLQAGVSETDLATQFMTSPEYASAHPSSNTLVNGLYEDILGRTPDLATQLQTVQALDSQPVSAVVQSLITSSESLANIVDNGYRAMLRRPATTAEISYWSGQLSAGAITPGALMQNLLSSSEFYQLAFNSAH